MARSLVLVDGEHYPAVVRGAINALAGNVVGVVLVGGGEKLRDGAASLAATLAPTPLFTGATPLAAVQRGLAALQPDDVVDLADEPVLDPGTRGVLIAHVLAHGIPYEGPGYRYDPPYRPRVATKPSIAIIGAGKRTGKTAIAGAMARTLAAARRPPIIVTMGRGGPDEPELVDPASMDLSPRGLLDLVAEGKHAASDHLEDAVTTGVVTIGTHRCGGGIAGVVGPNTFTRGVQLANARDEPIILFEGSGRVIPPAHADATVCVVSERSDPEQLTSSPGAISVLLSDVIVVTVSDDKPVDRLERAIRALTPSTPLLRVTLRPFPLALIDQRSVFLAATGTPSVVDGMATHLESAHGARVVGRSHHLADREQLVRELEATTAEVLVTELKAAAVDAATVVALRRGMEVVFCDNRPSGPGAEELEQHVRRLADAVSKRFSQRV